MVTCKCLFLILGPSFSDRSGLIILLQDTAKRFVMPVSITMALDFLVVVTIAGSSFGIPKQVCGLSGHF